MRPLLSPEAAIVRRLWSALWLCALVALAAREDVASSAEYGLDGAQAIKPPAFAFAYPSNLPTPFILAYTTWNGLPMTHALVGSQYRGFVLDTALNGCALKLEASKSFGLPAATSKANLRVFDQAVSVDQMRLPKLTFNLLSLANVSVGLMDVAALLSPTHARQSDAPVGWLGAPFFATFQTTFLFDRQAVSLERPDAQLPGGKGMVTIPMDVSADGRVMVLMSLPGVKPFPALLATSAPITVIPADIAKQAKLKPLDVMPVVQPSGDKAQVARIVVPRLSVGKATVDEANAVYVTSGSTPTFGPKTAVLGLDFLRHFHVTLNYARRLVAFAPLPKPGLVPPKKPEKADKEAGAKRP